MTGGFPLAISVPATTLNSSMWRRPTSMLTLPSPLGKLFFKVYNASYKVAKFSKQYSKTHIRFSFIKFKKMLLFLYLVLKIRGSLIVPGYNTNSNSDSGFYDSHPLIGRDFVWSSKKLPY